MPELIVYYQERGIGFPKEYYIYIKNQFCLRNLKDTLEIKEDTELTTEPILLTKIESMLAVDENYWITIKRRESVSQPWVDMFRKSCEEYFSSKSDLEKFLVNLRKPILPRI